MAGRGAKCGAKTRGDGRCKNPAGFKTSHPGTGTCHLHLGATKNHVTAGTRHLAESKIRKALDEHEVPDVENPLLELQRLTAQAVAFKDWAARHVAALEDRIRFTDDKGGEQLRAEVAVYERAMDRAAKLCESWARLGLDAMLAAMQVRVTEQQTAVMVRGLDAYRKAAGVGEDDHQAGLAALAKAMRG